ncbi:MAG: hypothetical protein WAO58_07935 [Fimbriimonadaceae bacterium]
MHRLLAFVFGLVLTPALMAQITLGQMDTFQDGTVMGWAGGASPTNIATGGPFGDGDRFLRITTGFRNHLATYNTTRWSGNYAAAGVNLIQVFLKNLGSTELSMRVVLHGVNGSRWTTTKPVVLPVGSGWKQVNFRLDEAALTRVVGTGTFADAYTNVDRLMLRHSTDLSSGGTTIVGQLGIDRIHARRLVSTGLKP